jgi:hypothetical protein
MGELEPFTGESLAAFYATISAPDGVSVTELKSMLADFTERPRSRADTRFYREGGKPWKKLKEEVVPVAVFLGETAPPDARVRFPLDDGPADAWLSVGNDEPIGIEVTGALARARMEVGASLADGKPVPGFIGLQDDATSEAFARVRARGRITSARVSVDKTIDEAILRRLEAKDKAKYAGHILLIDAPLGSSPNRKPADLQAKHGARAAALPFAAVYLLDAARSSSIVRLK